VCIVIPYSFCFFYTFGFSKKSKDHLFYYSNQHYFFFLFSVSRAEG